MNSNSFKNNNIIDLTHSITTNIPTWNNTCGFRQIVTTDYGDSKTEARFRVQTIEMVAGLGTHMDSPAHCFPEGKTIGDIGLNQLINSCVVINVSDRANENYCISRDDVLSFEKQYGVIKENTFVIMLTGWEKFWNQPDRYRNNLIFPSVSKAAAELLLERNICGLGIDTLSPDCPQNGFPVHQLLLAEGKYIVENMANTNKLTPVDATILILPLKIPGITESPVRVIGFN